MDDSCAVCAEALEWVAYGPCGHREVCATCVIRLRLVLDDNKCCICKAESPTVFVTRAMGDYTRVINDFSVFPLEAREGKVGDQYYWYHEDSQAYFDDDDQYKTIMAMCRLSCSVCDGGGGQADCMGRSPFRTIGQLKGHLFHKHNLLLCCLCLESKKVFLCEQKLYTRTQLDRHVSTGDSAVDGDLCERGGFAGHPMCGFCKRSFYGDSELYTHMTKDHFTCHICRRRDPGKFEYFRDYDDLENHFRYDHHLCEDESCLAEKFVVFTSRSELKRHAALKHGGHMHDSKRGSVPAVPLSITSRSNAEDQRQGRGSSSSASYADDISRAIQGGVKTGGGGASLDSEAASSSGVNALGSLGTITGSGEASFPVPSERSLSPEPSVGDSAQAAILGSNPESTSARHTDFRIEEASFPALPVERPAPAPSESHKNKKPALPILPGVSAMTNDQRRTSSAQINGDQNRLQSKRDDTRTVRGNTQSGSTSTSSISPHHRPDPSKGKCALSTGSAPSSSSSSPLIPKRPKTTPPQSSKNNHPPRSHSANTSDKKNKQPVVVEPSPPTAEADAHTANKSLKEKIRSAPGMNKAKFTAFKGISAEYRQGTMDAAVYVAHVQDFGLSHLVMELAHLCPDIARRRELVDIYIRKTSLQFPDENAAASSSSGPPAMVAESSSQGEHTKQRKKASNVLRVRMGDGSAAALLGIDRSDAPVWDNGGGIKLFTK